MSDPSPNGNGPPKVELPPLPVLADRLAGNLSDDRRAELARWLRLPVECLHAMPRIGFFPEPLMWTFPETDRHGAVVAIVSHSPGDSPRLFPGDRRGLTPAAGWADGTGPVFLPFGPLDALALAAVGLPAVGRSGMTSDLDELAALLAALDPARPVIVLGTNEGDGDDWPGLDRAERAAGGLADRLGRPVRWAAPPPEYLDVRAWVVAWLSDPADAGQRRELGEDLCAILTGAARTARPGGHARETAHGASGRPEAESFPTPVPVSALAAPGAGTEWLWHGFLARDGITLLSALPKCGKTTLLAHLLAALPAGGSFLGRPLAAGRAVVVSEEPAGVWAARRDQLGLTDAVRLIPRGGFVRSTFDGWAGFVAHLTELLKSDPADLVVFDSLASVWPVRDENNATDVGRALSPLHRLCRGRSVLLVHHIRKSDGREGTAARGSGALGAFVDLMLELRRVKTAGGPRTHRLLTGYGRYDAIPAEWPVELVPGDPPGYAYRPPQPEAEADAPDPLRAAILAVLPTTEPGMTRSEIWAALPVDLRRNEKRFESVLESAVPRLWQKGRKAGQGGGFLYWLAEVPKFRSSESPGVGNSSELPPWPGSPENRA